ncbi:DUF1317 family protein [Enterobacter hormaechei]|nr:DUF1317 family protein [Enterobacter hormaechei]
MTHAHDDIRVGTVCLPFIGNGWLMPWGEVVSNPLHSQRPYLHCQHGPL